MTTRAKPRTKPELELQELEARRDRERAQEAHLWLQASEIQRRFDEDDAESKAQRIYDFTKEVSNSSVTEAIDWLSSWRHKNAEPITFRIYSPGGSVFAGLALYDYIKQLRTEGIEVNTVALGPAFSMGGILLQAGTKRLMAPHAWLLIHEISTIDAGKTSELEDSLKWTKRIQGQLVEILAERSTLSASQIKTRWLKKDWTLTAQEALELGFIDAIAETP